jgi:hypothetical protein
MAFNRRLVLGRRATTGRLACCSRCVKGKSRTNEVDVLDAVIQLVQQGSSFQGGQMRYGMGH